MASDDSPAASGKELAPPAAPVCRVCGEPLPGHVVVECCACGTLHHDRCWRFNRGCSVYGCGSRSSRAPARTPAHPGGNFEIVARPDPAWSVLTLMATLALAVGYVIHLADGSEWVPLFAAAFTLALGTCVASLTRRVQMQVDPLAGAVHRRAAMFGKTWNERRNWLPFSDIVELHLHHHVFATRRGQGERFSLFALLSDGRRRLLRREYLTPATEERRREEIALAERLAECADCTVRHFSSDAAPAREEIARIVEQWRIDARPSRPELPPGPPPP